MKCGQRVYAFERGEGKVLKLLGYYEGGTEEVYEVEMNSEVQMVRSSDCFAIDKRGVRRRKWKLHTIEIEITYDPIALVFHGSPTWVKYSDSSGDEELFEEGDGLHQDWEGMGLNFPEIISKWLRRLNGERIPLSNYYKDPFNRWLDNLG